MSDEFTSAAPPSGGVTWADHKGKLLVIEPLSYETGIKTVHDRTAEGSDAVRANVYVITGPGESEDFEDTLVFPKVLQGQLKRQIGKKVVGRLGQGQQKPGQSAPWILAEATADDIAKAQAWQAARSTPAFASAAAPSAQPPF